MADTQQVVDNLVNVLGDDKEKHEAMRIFIDGVGEKHGITRVNGALIDTQIAELDKAISEQMDEILHHEDFQALESAWRGLQYLIENTEFSKPVRIEMIDVTKQELFDDLEEAKKNGGYEKESALWHHLYWQAYDKVGGHPYTAIVSDYQFGNTQQDIKLLQHVSVLSEMAQLPFIGNVNPQFFGQDNFEKVMTDRYLETKIKEDPKYIAWQGFRNQDRSKYIGLALPRFLGRLPYGKESDPTKNFNYDETVISTTKAKAKAKDGEDSEKTEGAKESKKDNSLWVNASFAMASNMIRSFENSGWSVKIVGVDSGGRVENLPLSYYEEHGETKVKVPVEASVGESKDKELSDMGFMALAHWDRTDYACFFEAPSVQRPKEIKNNPEATANYSVGARMQYTMLVTRIAHYLKYRQLRYVGRNAGKKEIQDNLTEWLSGLVADFPNPQEDVIAERPLRSFKLDVEELEERPGFFQINLELRPHIAIVGMDLNLRLVAYHSGEE